MADVSAASILSTAASGGRRPHICRTAWLAPFWMAWKVIAARLLGFGPAGVVTVLGRLSPSRSPFRMAWKESGCSLTEHPCRRNKKNWENITGRTKSTLPFSGVYELPRVGHELLLEHSPSPWPRLAGHGRVRAAGQ